MKRGAKSGGRDWPLGIAQGLAFVVPLAAYLRTLAVDLTFVDSGELAAVAATLGIAHPPGYPLYTLLGHLASQIPAGPVIARIALVSAVAAALATALLFRAAWGVVARAARADEVRRVGDDGSTRDRLAGRERLAALAGTLGGVLLFAFASTTWSQAVIVEVYALHAALCAAVLLACRAALDAPDGRGWILGLLAFGLAMAHHLTAVLLAPTLAVTLALLLHGRRRETKADPGWPAGAWWRPLGDMWIALLPLLLYAYLPLRSRQDPVMNWDYPETWRRLWMHVSARQYQGHLGSQGLRMEELTRFFGTQLPAEATLLLPLAALAGAIVLARRRPGILLMSAPLVIGVVTYNLAYPIADIQAYYLPVLLVFSLWAAIGCGWGAAWLARLVRAGRGTNLLALFVAAVVAAVPLVKNFRANDLRGYRDAAWFVRDALALADSGAAIFSADNSDFTSPAAYLQHVEGVRRDIVIVDIGRLASPLLARDLGKRLPELAADCREELAAGAALARMAEAGQPYDVEWARGVYHTMQRQLARAAARRYPTYAQGGTFQHQMFVGLQRHPEGMLVRLTSDPGYRPFALPRFAGLEAMQALPATPERAGLVAEYHRMLDGRLRYLEHHQRAVEAEALRAEMERLFGTSVPLPTR